jgi:putative SbcD/Mre11-related phosphoesterase
MKLLPIPQEPALLLKGKKKILVVTDLHIGMEAELKEAGINIPSQTRKIADHLYALCNENEVDEMILLGDVKHNVPLTSRQEYFEIPSIFRNLKERVDEVHVVPGNHDGGLGNLLPGWIHIHDNRGFVFEKVGFFHGHTWPAKEVMKCKTVLIGHEHPTVRFTETLGDVNHQPCWVKAIFIPENIQKRYPDSNPELIIIPAFNRFCGGTSVNDKKSGFLSPVVKNSMVDIDSARIYLLDGTYLGENRNLRL